MIPERSIPVNTWTVDTHLHTIASGHAYSTLHDYVAAAKEKHVTLMALTDHGPAMPGASNIWHLGNQKVIPDLIDGIRVLKGVEANIVDYSGEIDIREPYIRLMDIVIGSLHVPCLEPGTRSQNTDAFVNAMASGNIDVTGHPGNPVFPIDIEAFVAAAKAYDVLIEINNSSFHVISRRGSRENCLEIARTAKRMGARVIMGSDAHISFDLAKLDQSYDMLQEVGMPRDLIMNFHPEALLEHLAKRKEARNRR